MDEKTRYLERELWILAWNASVQRAAIYRKGARQTQREQINTFKNKIIAHIRNSIIPQYKEAVDELHHCKNIRGLIDYANGIDTGVL